MPSCPTGCPVDELERVGDRHLGNFGWLWVGVYTENLTMAGNTRPTCTDSTMDRTSDPLETVLCVMEDGFVARSMIPWCRVPSHSRPAADLHCAFDQVKEIWAELGESPKHMLLSLLGVWNAQQRELLTAHGTDNKDGVANSMAAKTIGKERLFFPTHHCTARTQCCPSRFNAGSQRPSKWRRPSGSWSVCHASFPLAARVDGIYWATECLESAIELNELAAGHRYNINRRPVYTVMECRMGKMPANAQGFEHKDVPLYHTMPWTHAEELDAQEILDNGGALATGAAGAGKSYILHKLKGRVPDATVCAYTRAATRFIGRRTVVHDLLSLNTWGKWIFVDEVSLPSPRRPGQPGSSHALRRQVRVVRRLLWAVWERGGQMVGELVAFTEFPAPARHGQEPVGQA